MIAVDVFCHALLLRSVVSCSVSQSTALDDAAAVVVVVVDVVREISVSTILVSVFASFGAFHSGCSRLFVLHAQ